MRGNSEWVVYRTRGGLLSLAELRKLAEAATARGEPRLYAVGRQEIALSGLGLAQANRLLGQPGSHFLQSWSPNRPANIMTTGAVAGLNGTNSWLSEGTFRDLLASFAFVPRRSIALADPSQPYLPAFLGEICFLATERRDQWRIRLALPEFGEESLLPGAIRSMDIPKAAEIIEGFVGQGASHESSEGLRAITEALGPIQLPTAASVFPRVPRYESPQGALIIPIPEEGIRSEFCLDLCIWAARHPGISIGLTPWHSFLIRGLSDVTSREVRALLIRWRVAENGGAWRTHCLDSKPERDVDWLCRMLDVRCPVDTGLSIGVSSADAPAPDVHILVREPSRVSWWHRFRSARYTVQRRDSGDARKGSWIDVAASVRRQDLGAVILQTIETITDPAAFATIDAGTPAGSMLNSSVPVYRCQSCLSEYSAVYGDPASAIVPGTAFDSLSADWNCPVCGGPKSAYEAAA